MPRRSKKEVDAIIQRGKFLGDLLEEFDARLVGWDPGVLASWRTSDMHSAVSLDFNRRQWEWLEPILIELRQFRKEEAR